MNWDNYGVYLKNKDKKWHIDHIIPQSTLPYTNMEDENFKKCWALENLRPLESVENMKKGSKFI
jgi:5-methylcytosine-specific restriction endonuclease McrA